LKDSRASICPAGGAHHWLYWWEDNIYMRECLKCHEKGEAPEVRCKKRPGTHLVINPATYNVERDS